MIRRLAPVVAACLIAAGCVWPIPAPGEPIPEIEITTTWHAADEVITVDVTVTYLQPTGIAVYPDGLAGPRLLDADPPFSVDVPTAGFEPGNHSIPVVASDGATIVLELEDLIVHGCNRSIELCARPYDEIRQATTHNAMSSATDGWTGPNQTPDVPQQLELGVRALMLDTYRAGDLNGIGQVQVPGVDPDTPYLCHTFCALGSQPLVEGLTEIATFLDTNPGAVVTLIIESYLNHDLTAAAFAAAGLAEQAYVHTGPAWPTLGELIDADTRLVVVQDENVDPAYPWLMDVWDLGFETHFSATTPADFSCADNRGTPDNDLFILNHFLTELFGSPALAEQVNHNPLLIDRIRECEAFHSTPTRDVVANFVTVDFVDIGDTIATVDTLNHE